MKTLALSLILSIPASAGLADEWAIGGFDAVGYDVAGQPMPGRSDIATLWKGKVWHFASEANRDQFEADPMNFAPAFGGNCPVALAEGRREPGDPTHFAIVGDRLYLFSSEAAEQQLLSDPPEVLDRANQSWGDR